MKKPLFYSLPPAGQKIPFKELIKCLAKNLHATTDMTNEAIKQYLGNNHVLYLSSGRAALWLYLKTVSIRRPERKEVIIPAYTCPSVVSAVLKAGLTPVLCDNNLDDFGYLSEEFESKLSRSTLAVIAVHLYGLPVKINKIKDLCRNNGTCFVEDAAQAFGNPYQDDPDSKLGLKGDAGFYSFGRGKPISIMHGGLLVVNSSDEYQEAEKILQGLKKSNDKVHYCISLGLYAFFSNPHLYWIPQMIPFLNLGGTVFEPEFETARGLDAAAELANVMVSGIEEEKEVRKNNTKWYSDNLPQGFINQGGRRGEYPYLRYPVMIEDEDLRTRILERLIAEGTGATGSYPTPLNELPKLREVLADGTKYSAAKKISESIVTLPVHSGVSAADRENIKRIIEAARHAN